MQAKIRGTSMSKESFSLALNVGPWFANSILLYFIEDQGDKGPCSQANETQMHFTENILRLHEDFFHLRFQSPVLSPLYRKKSPYKLSNKLTNPA